MKKKLAPPIAFILLSLCAPLSAEPARSADLRYCLDLKSNEEIAKCAGEISRGPKSRPMSRKEVETVLEKETRNAPVGPGEASGVPATTSGVPATDASPGKN